MRIVVAEARVPYVADGATLHARALIEQLRRRGHQVELVSLPLDPAKDRLLDQAAAWRLLNLAESNTTPIDRLIATRFPTWFARHPHKVAWVIHQHRQAYELFGTPFSDFADTPADRTLRDRLVALDNQMLAECRHIVTNAANTAGRLRRFNGIDAQPLYHPPPLADALREGTFGDYVLVVARLEPLKRVSLAIEAMALVPPPTRLVVVGEGSLDQVLRERAAALGLGPERVEFVGAVWGDRVVDLYADALAVVYTPFDEDYGYVTLEAFLAGKPVVTAVDSGGPLEFVVHDTNGLVVTPDPAAVAAAIASLAADRERSARLGRAGHATATAITWDGVVERLLG